MNIKQANVALRWFESMRNDSEWGLIFSEQVQLLGDIGEVEFSRVNGLASECAPATLSDEVFERLRLLVSIYKVLKDIAPSSDSLVGVKWFFTPNEGGFFKGRSPKVYLLESGSLEAMYDVYTYLNSIKQGSTWKSSD